MLHDKGDFTELRLLYILLTELYETALSSCTVQNDEYGVLSGTI